MTGATGFVGQHVLSRLLDEGYRVKALVRPSAIEKTIDHENLNWIEGGLSEVRPLRALCSEADVLIHIAGLITARTRDEYFETNARAVASLTGLAKQAEVKRMVLLSSLAAREPNLSAYAASKRAGEGAMARRLGPNMQGVVVRAPAVFGPGDQATAPIFTAIRRGFLPCPGGRNWQARKFSLLYIDDLVDSLVGPCLSGQYDGRTIYPSTCASLTWPSFAQACSKAQQRSVRPIPLPISVLTSLATMTSASKKLTGKGHLTLEKLREFLHEDWSVNSDLESGTCLQSAIKNTITALN